MHRVAAALSGLLLASALAGEAVAAATEDWPCVQPRVAELSPGQMWAGPPLDAAGNWRDDPEVAALVPRLAARRTSLEEAAAAIQRFAESAGPDKDKRLTRLFAGVFERLNAERSRLVAGIERLARKQKALADRIRETEAELRARRANASPALRPSPELEERFQWDTRIYDERTEALTYVCESPVIIEQRVFALAREIQNHLE
jgi:hypothetical protein